MFCIAILFIDVLENIFLHIQNPHDQTVLIILTLALHNYAEPSNRCLKLKTLSQRILPLLAPENSSQIVLSSFNEDCSVQDRFREPKLSWLELGLWLL
jgi:hypothetical protein